MIAGSKPAHLAHQYDRSHALGGIARRVNGLAPIVQREPVGDEVVYLDDSARQEVTGDHAGIDG